jgi:hypothetical protein
MPAYDLHFQTISIVDQTSGYSGKFFTFGFPKPIGVAGPQKLLNRWVKLFFTTQGSDSLFPDNGGGFTSLIGSNITEVGDLQSLMNLYIESCNDQLQTLDALDNGQFLTTDERLRSGTMTAFNSLPPDGFEAFVQLVSISGKSVTVLIPMSVT